MIVLPERTGYHRMHADRSLDYQCNRFLEAIGPEALPEIRAAAAGIGGYDDWVRAFFDLADRARADGRDLAAAQYDRAAEFYLRPGDPRRGPARARFVKTLRETYGLWPQPVPFGEFSLPAYDFGPDPAPRGTIVLHGGFDSYVEEFFPVMDVVAEAGFRVIAFDGPGQGGALEDDGLALTARWERPVGAVLDHFGLDDVTLAGISLGGGLAIRAAAFDPRIRRVIADDVLDDFLECLARQAGPGLTGPLRLLLALRARPVVDLAARVLSARPVVDWGVRQGMHITGTSSPYHFLRAARAFTTRAVSARVTADVLLLAGADDHYVPAHQLHRQAAALTGARSVTTRVLTAAEQAQNHCHVGNTGASLRVMLAWLDSL